MKKQKRIKQILSSQGFLGHKIGRKLKSLDIGIHPSITTFLLGNRQKMSIIDIHCTLKCIIKSLYILMYIIKKKRNILFVNTNPEISSVLHHFAKKTSKLDQDNVLAYSNVKWIGGTLTNWKKISLLIDTYSSFSRRYDWFITKNNIHFPKYKKLKKSFQGFTKPPRKPDIVFVVNPNNNKYVLNEANRLNIPVIALTDTNTDLSLVTYPIPVNNNSIFIIHFYFSWILRILKYRKIKK